MADNKKISELAVATTPTGAELTEIVQGGVNKQTTLQEIADLATGGVWGGITGTLSNQTDLNAALNLKADALTTYRTLTIDHTLDSTDLASINAGLSLIIEENQAIANDVTVPANATVAFPVGTVITVIQMGAGLTSIIADGGVTINASAVHLNSPGVNSPMTLIKKATNTWYLFNGLPSATAVWQNWGSSLTPTGFSAISVQDSWYQDDGQTVHIWGVIGGTSNAVTFTFSLPINLSANYTANGFILLMRIQNNGTNATGYILGTLSNGVITVHPTVTGAANSWTASGGKVLWFHIFYQR